jgi:hypothetical protein
MPAWRRRRFMKIRTRARKLGLVRGSKEWRAFLGLPEIITEEPKTNYTASRELRPLVPLQAKRTLSKPIPEPPSVKVGKVTKEDRRPRAPGKRR